MDAALTPLLWFALVVAVIPAALWLLKRTPLGGGAQGAGLRCVSVLPLSGSQRIVTVEVGQGDERRWLVLGVTPSSITTLHTMAPQAEPPGSALPSAGGAFGEILGRLRGGSAPRGESR
jgi:flagellar protein FliO/FliZ